MTVKTQLYYDLLLLGCVLTVIYMYLLSLETHRDVLH